MYMHMHARLSGLAHLTNTCAYMSIDAWEQCNHTRKTELNRYLVHALEQTPIHVHVRAAIACLEGFPQPRYKIDNWVMFFVGMF